MKTKIVVIQNKIYSLAKRRAFSRCIIRCYYRIKFISFKFQFPLFLDWWKNLALNSEKNIFSWILPMFDEECAWREIRIAWTRSQMKESSSYSMYHLLWYERMTNPCAELMIHLIMTDNARAHQKDYLLGIISDIQGPTNYAYPEQIGWLAGFYTS